MRIPSHHGQSSDTFDRAMTPLIDVVFLLLIFFVCASIGQIRESLLPTDLAGGAIEAQEFERREKPFGEIWLYLRVDADRQTVVQVNEAGVEYRDLRQLAGQLHTLAELTTEVPVILDIAAEVPLQDVIRVYDACRAARFDSVNFATNPPAAVKSPAEP